MLARFFAFAGFALLLCAGPNPAAAHAVLVESTPAVSATVNPGRIEARLHYNSRIDRVRSRLTLTRANDVTEIVPILDAGEPDVIKGVLNDLAPGRYMLRWQVLAIDGHITRGSIPFTVRKSTE